MTDLFHLGKTMQPPLPVRSYPAGQPTRFCYGLMSRESAGAHNPPTRTMIRSYVYEVDWSVAQPIRFGPIAPQVVADLTTENDYADTYGLNVRVRLFVGIRAPDWVKTLSGFTPLPWYSSDSPDPAGTVGPFWRADYAAAYDDFIAKMAAVMAPLTRMCEVTISGPSTVYAEPYIRSWRSMTNSPQPVIDAGYTVEADQNSFVTAIQTHLRHMVPAGIGSCMAHNPWQRLDMTKAFWTTTDLAFTLDKMRYMREVMGKFGVLGNNSVGSPVNTRGNAYVGMFNALKAYRAATDPFPSPIYFQTMTIKKMKAQPGGVTTPYTTAEMLCHEYRSLSVEMPAGWTNDPDPFYIITPAQADALNADFLTNALEVGSV